MNAQPLAHDTDLGTTTLRFLIADDHSVVRLGVKHIVLGAFPNAEVGEAANGQEVLEAVRTEPWDVLILDIGMPVRSGLEIMSELRHSAPNLRIASSFKGLALVAAITFTVSPARAPA